jgi:hypothetical protein
MTDSIPDKAPPPTWWRLGPALWLAAAVILVSIYLVFNLPGSWFGGGATQTYPGAAMGIATGYGQAEGDKLVITRPDSKNAAIIALVTPRVSTLEYGLVAFDIDGMPEEAEVTMFWRNDLAPNKMFTRTMTVAGGRVQDAMLAGDSNWLGRINTIGLIIRGSLNQPVSVNRVALSPATAGTVLMERWRDWFDRESWTGISLSRVIGGRPGMNLPLSLLAGVAALLGCLAYWGLQRWRGWQISALTIAAIIGTGWLVLDMRWQWNLIANAAISVNKYANHDLSEKRLAGIDAELEKIALELRPLIPKDARLFVVAPDAVIAGRFGYLLLPARVHYDIAVNALPVPELLKPGDLMLIHRKAGVRYSPERKELLWNDRFRIKVDILFLKAGTVLARVTG